MPSSSYLIPCAALAAIVWIVQKWWDNSSRLRRIPTPDGASRIWGHEWLEFEDDRGSQWKEWISKSGPVFKIKGAWRHHDILCITDVKAIDHILVKNSYRYPHSDVFRPIIERLTGRGIVWLEAEAEHKPIRAILAPAFTLDRVRGMAPDIWYASNATVARLAGIVEQSGGVMEVNALDWTSNSTLDVIGRVAFAHDFEQGQGPEGILIMEAWRKQANLGMEFGGFLALLLLRQFPFIGKLPLPAIEAQSAIKNTIKPLARRLIERGVDDLERGRDLLSILLRANASEEKRKRISDDNLLDHIVTFVIAGHETTSVVLNMTLYALAMNPDVQQKLREEINAYPGEPTFDELWATDKFPYLDGVIREGFRLYPPSARNEKVAERDDILPLLQPIVGTDGKLIHEIPIKAGQTIHIPTVAINRLASVWGDGDAFRPERWIEKKNIPGSDFLPGTWSQNLTFLTGPRSCLGYRLAVFEMKVLLISYTRQFHIEPAGEIETRMSATIQPRVVGREHEGACMPLRLRNLQ